MEKRGISLTSLDPKWVRDKNGDQIGISFRCPVDGDICPMVRVVIHWKQPPGWRSLTLWDKTGDDFQHLTLSPSLDGTHAGCKFHGWVKNGRVTWI